MGKFVRAFHSLFLRLLERMKSFRNVLVLVL